MTPSKIRFTINASYNVIQSALESTKYLPFVAAIFVPERLSPLFNNIVLWEICLPPREYNAKMGVGQDFR